MAYSYVSLPTCTRTPPCWARVVNRGVPAIKNADLRDHRTERDLWTTDGQAQFVHLWLCFWQFSLACWCTKEPKRWYVCRLNSVDHLFSAAHPAADSKHDEQSGEPSRR